MKKLILPGLAGLFLLALLVPSTACWYDNEEELYGGDNGCDTTGVNYSTQVITILNNNCYSCHSVGSNVAGSTFDNYADLKVYVDNGQLIDLITTDGVGIMPPTGKMSDCEIERIQAWVNAGALDN